MAHVCPHCGGDLSVGAIETGRWRLSPGMAEFDGRKLSLSPSEASILHTLAHARGDIVDPPAIGASFSSVDPSADTVRVLVRRLRIKLGDNCPIETIRSHGYRWREPEMQI